jgi:hypothetical protein
MKFGPRPFRLLALPVVALFALSACDDSTNVDDTIAIVRVNVGTQTVLVDQSGMRSCCDGAGNATLNTAVQVPQGASNPATATLAQRTQLTVFTFHRSDGTPIILDPNLYEVRVTPANSTLTWTPIAYPAPTGQSSVPFSGNLIRPTAGSSIVDVTFSVVEKASGNVVFGPNKFTICTVITAAVAATQTTPYVPAKCTS